MIQNERSNLQAILAEVFEFSPADIAANRAGEISAAQKARITNTHYANSRAAWELFFIIFGLGLLGFSAEMIRTENMGVKSLLTYFGVTAFLGLIVWAFILYYRHQMKRTLRAGSAQLVEGTIQLITERGEKTQSRYFCVCNHRFRIDKYEHFVVLQQSGVAGRQVIAYVSSPWHDLLSVILQT
ncbi:MAG: hypothetical protein F6K00_00640 [Leptolyngbya sp. SIOISBB]|nr:hypothetical protein [Leptolyngbya sp. SIOISBB]